MTKRAAKPVGPDPQAVARTKFIEQGTDPVIAKKALEDATGVSRALWLSFLTFGTYLVITFAGVDHRDLLLETPITLPVLNAPLPLVTFFWVAPILFVIFHLYLLLSLKLLADQVHHYVETLRDSGLDEEAQDKARLQLPNFVMVQVLGGTSTQINSWSGKLMTFTAFLTLVAGPLILLLFAQLMFLPYHGWGVTMSHRVMVVIDLVFIWYFWRAIRRSPSGQLQFISLTTSLVVVTLAIFGFTYPGERQYGPLARSIFLETGANESSSGLDLFYNTLNLPGARLVDEDQYNELVKRNTAKGLEPGDGERSLEVTKYRDFRNSNFNNIDLRKANLNGVNFDGARLAEASLLGVQMTKAFLRGAILDSIILDSSRLDETDFQQASLDKASLRCSSLVKSKLWGVSLRGGRLQGANFAGAMLQGADITHAFLLGSSFRNAFLQGTSLDRTHLQGVDLRGASLNGASLEHASLQGASLDSTIFQGASLLNARVWRAYGSPILEFADLQRIDTSPSLASFRSEASGSNLDIYERLMKESVDGLSGLCANRMKLRLSRIDPNAAYHPSQIYCIDRVRCDSRSLH